MSSCCGASTRVSLTNVLKVKLDTSQPVYSMFFSMDWSLPSSVLKTRVMVPRGVSFRWYGEDLSDWIRRGVKGICFTYPAEEGEFINRYGLAGWEYA